MSSRSDRPRIAAVGGGAAGFFAAIAAAESGAQVTLFEAASRPLGKVRISGGGRCNVTAACYEPRKLASFYPRGSRELLGPFTRFQPKDLVQWFESRGVALKTEEDGRIFPATDSSDTVIDCLLKAAREAGVDVRLRARVRSAARTNDGLFTVDADNDRRFESLLLTTGSNEAGYAIARTLGHTIEPLVPSLFTFVVKHPLLDELPGISFSGAQVTLKASGQTFRQTGPVLITHWGLSGPAILKLSAWGARALCDAEYRGDLEISWVKENETAVAAAIAGRRENHGKRQVDKDALFSVPGRFWTRIAELSGVQAGQTWASLPKEPAKTMKQLLLHCNLQICGKGEFKEEFVTCGGVRLAEVDFRTMESKIVPNLYLAGEILDIDGVTGGYNLQSAWTTGWIAGNAMGGN